jgi:hypothetical protein
VSESDEVGVGMERLPREVIADWTKRNEQRLTEALEASLVAVRNVSCLVECRFCRKSANYVVPAHDTRAVIGTIEMLLTQGFGRAAPAETSEQEQTVVSYSTVLRDEERERAIRDEFTALLENAVTLEDARSAARVLLANENEGRRDVA